MSFFGTLIFAAYCANLISILLSTKVKAPFNSYDSLYHDTNYEIGYIAGTRIDETLRVIKTLVQTCLRFRYIVHNIVLLTERQLYYEEIIHGKIQIIFFTGKTGTICNEK